MERKKEVQRADPNKKGRNSYHPLMAFISQTTNGFQTYGCSMNLDYLIRNNMIWRIEGRGLSSKDEIFIMDGKPFNQNYFLTTCLAISF